MWRCPALANAPRVDVDYGGAAAELAGDLRDKFGALDRGGVNADFLGPRLDKASRIFEGPNAAADGKGHKQFLGDPPHDIKEDGAPFVTGADVEED